MRTAEGQTIVQDGRESSQAGALEAMARDSMAARYWTQPGYRYESVSIHDQRVARFWSHHPFSGWADVRVGELSIAMLNANDDGVALIYHAFGPDAYEAASVAAWAALAPECRQILDVGAFTGLFAMLARKASPEAKVVAVEPNSANRARLNTNLAWNGFHNVIQVAPYAVSSELQTLPLFVPMGADQLDTGSSLNRGHQVTRTELVTAGTIDALMLQYGLNSPDLLKIDVEGFEEAALKGATRALAARATLILEIQPGLFERCRSLLLPHGYQILAVDDAELTLTPLTDAPPERFEQIAAGGSINCLCVARDSHRARAEAGVARVRRMLTDSRTS